MEKYDPIRVLGEGSFGKVYLMRDKVRRKFVCVKIIKIKNIPKKEREATKVEVELLKRLNHPNIVRYIDSFLSRNNESLCIAMEYCDGGDLASQIKAARRKLFSEDKILHWFVQIALGVHYMHTKSVLHRDLKTQNIFLLGNGRLVLGDLGISKVLEGTMDFAQTCIGTPYYMSPEIFKNKPYSYKSDVWALGCVLYEMTTLNHAFDANSLNGLAQKIIKGRYPSIHNKYSRYLRELIGHMLLPEPKQRPDLDQILRKPFIRKHILNFFQNIASRPSQSIGEGTMIVRAAAGGLAGALANDVNMLSFKEQLDSLGMTAAINEVLGGKQKKVEPAVLEDPVKAKRLAKEQSNALKREQDHRKMVESALEKLRKEREERARDRNRLAAAAIRRRGGGAEEKGHGQHGRHGDGPRKPAALRQPVNRRARSEDPDQHEKGKRVSEARENQGAARRRQEAEVAQQRRDEERREREAEKDRARQREDLLAREKREQARAQEVAAQRREAQRQRERGRQMAEIDQLKKDKLELDKRSNERDRIREERRRVEKARLDEARNSSNMDSKMSVADSDRLNIVGRSPMTEEKGDMSARDRMLQRKQDKQAREDQERMEALRAAEVENRRIRQQASSQAHSQYHSNKSPNSARRDDDEDATAQSKSQADRKARGSMEELTAKLHQARGVGGPRYEVANGDGRDQRDAGRGHNRGEDIMDYDSDSDVEEEASVEFGDDDDDEAAEVEEQEDMIRREEELQAELNLATRRCQELKETLQVTKSFLGKGPHLAVNKVPNEGTKIAEVIQSDDEEEEETDSDDEAEEYDEDEDNSWDRPHSSCSSASGTPRDVAGQDAAREKAVQKLMQPEYKRAESGSDELRVGTRVDARYKGGPKFYPGRISRVRLDGTYDIEYDDGECESRVGKVMLRLIETRKVVNNGPGGAAYKRSEGESETPRETPRLQRPMPIAVKQSSFKNLVDAPSPRGRLGDRIVRLRQRCMQALGAAAFEEAYAYLKSNSSNEDDGDMMDDELDNQKAQKVRDILGHDKAHYMPLIDQLIFMEDTHSG